jgi:hypothetical protein
MTHILETAALRDVLAERLRQVETFGHSPEADSELPVDWLVRKVWERAQIALDCVKEPNIPRARAKLETVPGEGFLSKRQRRKIAREAKKRMGRD